MNDQYKTATVLCILFGAGMIGAAFHNWLLGVGLALVCWGFMHET